MKLTAGFLIFSTIILSCFFLTTSCKRENRPHFKADISDIEIEPISIGRYEEVLFKLNPFTLRQDIEPYIERFRVFLGDAIDTDAGQQQLFDYITDPRTRELYLDTKEVWPDLKDLEKELTQAMRYYRFHFRDEPMPEFFTYISGLDYQHPVKYYDNIMVIGLDNYLGRDFHLYPKIGVPTYQTFGMQPAFVITDIVKMLAEKHLQKVTKVPELFLDFMIYEGKVLYFLDNMLPQHNDTLKIAYSADQYRWLQENLGRVWAFFLENEMLYSSDRQMIIKFIGDAPFTAPFTQNAPPRTAAYIGWQIVRQYMQRNPQISLQELLAETDSQKILKGSGFRP